MDLSTLTYQKRKDALTQLLFITEERNGEIKTRKVAVDNKQRTHEKYDKRNGSLPTVKTDSVFLTGVIDAHYSRSVAILDIDYSLLKAENDE